MLWVFFLSVTTAYCPGGNTITGDSNLGPVYLVGDWSTAISDTSDCPGGTGIVDLTSKSASLSPGGNYTLHFQATTCGGGWARMTFAYIDFNGNGVYDTNELLGQQNVDNRDTPIDVFFPFVVPVGNDTALGKTRMRVFVVESGFNTNPCQSFSYGGVKEFSIQLAPKTYCSAGNTMTGDSNLGPVKLIGDKQTAIDDGTNCPGGTGVIDLTSESASLKLGGSYTLNFQATTCGAAWNRLTFAYIDFNGNNEYEPSELLGQQRVGNAATPYDISFTFVVPSDDNGTKIGKTRMRVFVVEGGSSLDPCATFAYGGVKEFSIEISSNPQYCSAGNTMTGDSNLGPVKLVGEAKTAIADRTDCPGGTGVIDLTSESASLKPGGSYTLSFQATTCGAGQNRLVYAYIDFNGNSVYDLSELLGYQYVGDSVSPVEVSLPFVVPRLDNGTLTGRTRMRVFVVKGGLYYDPCVIFSQGGVKEFSIDIMNVAHTK